MMAAYVVVGVEYPGDVLCQVAVQNGLDVVTMVDCRELIGKCQALCSCTMKQIFLKMKNVFGKYTVALTGVSQTV